MSMADNFGYYTQRHITIVVPLQTEMSELTDTFRWRGGMYVNLVGEFFTASANTNSELKLKERNNDDNEFKGTKLLCLCETHWVERHKSVGPYPKHLFNEYS